MPIFSKRHYEWLAKQHSNLIESAPDRSIQKALIGATYQLSSALKEENPKFDENRFLKTAVPIRIPL